MSHEHSVKMSKPEQALTLDPACELHFKGPYNEVTTTYLLLTNPTDKIIGFKVKTTAPKTYCVRPNGGVIAPKKTVSVAVMLQPFDPENDDRSKDKFMVQSVYLPEGETTYYDALWQDVPPESLMNSKLKCIFDIPSADPPASAVVASEVSATPDQVEAPKPKVKASIVQEVKSPDFEAEAKKLYDDFKKLKAELSDLRSENSALKEEGLRSRIAQDTWSRGTSARPAESEKRHSQANNPPLPKTYMYAIASVIFFLGLYIGKAIL